MTRRLHTRLALLHAGLAFAGGVALLAFAVLPLLTVGHTTHDTTTGQPASERTTGNLATVLSYSAAALPVIGGLSIVVGWLVARRTLRPLRVLTSAARAMSAYDLGNRPRVRTSYREFIELFETLDGLLRRLHESFTAQRQFVANASHELRTPLAAQRALLQVTLADPDAPAETLRAACHELLILGQQQEHLINALLTLAGGYQPIDRSDPFDLAGLTAQIVLDHDAEAHDRGIHVRTRLAPTMVTGDARLAASLVTNLVENALRHNVPGGSVEITTGAPGRLAVSNTGTVVPPAELTRLFQPFQRLGSDRTDQTEGHGIGLAIVAAVAHAHSATLAANARPEGGLELTVDFPPAEQPR